MSGQPQERGKKMVDKANRVEELGQKYRMFFENMGEGACILDENMVITLANDKLCETSGYSRDELLGKKVYTFFGGVSKKIIRSEFKKRTKGKSSHYTLAGKTKEGKEMFFSVCSAPLFDKKRKFNGAIVIIADITEKKKSEKKLKERTIELEK
ncbi:MAG: PAS domain-containing protein, partial [bacterium]